MKKQLKAFFNVFNFILKKVLLGLMTELITPLLLYKIKNIMLS